jgi:hypothetical protein
VEKYSIKLSDIPKVNEPYRRFLIEFTKERFYQEEIEEKGIPFFSEQELKLIENKYKEKNGMTRQEMFSEIHNKGWLIKENTIKSYIQKGLLPRATNRVKTNKGMISLYPPTIIRHLNFVRYCVFSKDASISLLFKAMKYSSLDDKTILENASLEIDDFEFDVNDCLHSLWVGVNRIDDAIYYTEKSLSEAFEENNRNLKLYGNKLNEIRSAYKSLTEKISNFEDFLK